jgi:hypothetical protein
VADAVFNLQRELGHGFLKGRDIKDRIVSKALVPGRFPGDAALTDTLGLDPVSGRAAEDHDADEAGCPPPFRDFPHKGEELFVIRLIRGPWSGEAGRKDARGSLEGIDLESGIIR